MARTLPAEDLQGQPWHLNFGGKLTTGGMSPRVKVTGGSRLGPQHAGPKTCTQCGTGRTPQWREGPAGPKTLCNACGVKLVRKNRGVAEAKKRATPSADRAMHSLFGADRGSPSPEPWSGMDSGADEAAHLADAEPSRLGFALGKRPQRKAAARAASRTAEFASTGDWPEDELAAADALSDASMGGSDSAEEVAWTPGEGAVPAAPRSALPSTVRQETSAAINLLTMSYKDDKDLAPSTPTGHAQPVASPRTDASVPFQDAQTPPRSAVRLSLLRANSHLSEREQAVEAFMRTNAPARAAQYEALQAHAEAVWRQAAASDAAVAAVAKFLAQKQASAIRAREAAHAATEELHAYLHDTDAELGVLRSLKRQRQ